MKLICYRCGRSSKANKKNFPIPVMPTVVDAEGKKERRLVGYLCKVCARKAVKLAQARKTVKV